MSNLQIFTKSLSSIKLNLYLCNKYSRRSSKYELKGGKYILEKAFIRRLVFGT